MESEGGEKTEKKDDVNERYLRRPIEDPRILRRIKWDIDSPKFKEAQLNLGYSDTDLILRDMNYFQTEENVDKKIAKVRYSHHLIKLKQKVNELIEERLKIAKGDISTRNTRN